MNKWVQGLHQCWKVMVHGTGCLINWSVVLLIIHCSWCLLNGYKINNTLSIAAWKLKSQWAVNDNDDCKFGKPQVTFTLSLLLRWDETVEVRLLTGPLSIPQIICERTWLSMDNRCHDVDRGKLKASEEKRPQCHFVSPKNNVGCNDTHYKHLPITNLMTIKIITSVPSFLYYFIQCMLLQETVSAQSKLMKSYIKLC
jgi:hypothetical protein